MEKKIVELSKSVSYALRHAPWEYELEIDEEGWVSIEELLSALRYEKNEWKNLTIIDLANIVVQSDKQRHEIKNDKIRALYGHSTPVKLLKELAEPPNVLYHGTSPEITELIYKDGLKPMNRHYVHLSVDIEMAIQVGNRKSKKPVILAVRSKDAYQNGVKFYKGNEHVWLADFIDPKYIEVGKGRE